MTHTPTPWKLGTRFPCRIMSDKTGNHSNLVASTCLHADEGTETQEEKANAEFIVTACNSHTALVEALEAFVAEMDERIAESVKQPDGYAFTYPVTYIQAKKALAQATGQPERTGP